MAALTPPVAVCTNTNPVHEARRCILKRKQLFQSAYHSAALCLALLCKICPSSPSGVLRDSRTVIEIFGYPKLWQYLLEDLSNWGTQMRHLNLTNTYFLYSKTVWIHESLSDIRNNFMSFHDILSFRTSLIIVDIDLEFEVSFIKTTKCIDLDWFICG